MAKSSSRLVFSTDNNNRCRNCQRPLVKCVCKQALPQQETQGTVYVRRETKGRKGAGVTIVEGLVCSEQELKALARQLKKMCGVGGATKDGRIEIQGEHRARIQAELQEQGLEVKISGG